MLIPEIVYSNQKIEKDYLVCLRITNKWHVVECYDTPADACEQRDSLATDALISGLISDPLFYQVFHKNFVEIKELQ